MIVYVVLSKVLPIPRTTEIDEEDYFGTFHEKTTVLVGEHSDTNSLDARGSVHVPVNEKV